MELSERESVTVEFFGVPRLRAGRATLRVRPGSVTEVLARVAAACPRLDALLQPNGELSPHYLLSLGGEGFLTEMHARLRPGERVVLLSADAGG